MRPGPRMNAESTSSGGAMARLVLVGGLFLGSAHAVQAQPPVAVPALDRSRHSVALDTIYFDTFQPGNRAVPLTLASPALIERLRDAIPPLHRPRYEPGTTARWLSDNDMVMGYASGDEAWAFPLRILNYHEIVNDTLAREPVLIAYCPLCAGGVVFSRRLRGRVLTFGNTSALYESDMVMLDYDTGSYWWHVAGTAIVGTLTGQRLQVLPSMTTTWREWREAYPDSKVLSRNTGYRRPYARDPFRGYASALNRGRFAFPVSDYAKDGRLPPATRILAIKVGNDSRAYPLDRAGSAIIMDVVAHKRIVVFIGAGGTTGSAYEPVAGGRRLTFRMRSGGYVDAETNSVWDVSGKAVAGPLTGTRLVPIPSTTSFWFAVVAAIPTITVYADASR